MALDSGRHRLTVVPGLAMAAVLLSAWTVTGTKSGDLVPAAPRPRIQAAVASSHDVVRGIFRFKTQAWAELAHAGFNASSDGGVQEYGPAQARAGLAGSVWLNAYDNVTCRRLMSDTQIEAAVRANVRAGYRGLYYEVGDEPTSNGCRAEAAYRAMTAAVHHADPTARTWTVDDQFNDPDVREWPAGLPMAGTVDVLAFDVYPCFSPARARCDFYMIRDAAVRIRRARLRQPWWFVLQDFNRDGGSWRWPTPAELRIQYDDWQGAGAAGYFVYAWDADGSVTSQPGNVPMLKRLNVTACCGG